MTLEHAESFISYLRWQYAKTYPSYPHEYTCLSWQPEIKQQMIDFARLIQEAGYTERFGKRDYRVLVIGNMKYWTMDFPLENTDLINRTYADEQFRAKVASYVQSGKFNYTKGMSLADVTKQIESGTTDFIVPVGNLPSDFLQPSLEELNEFRSYIAKLKWQTAKTFENFSPHQYVLNFPCWKMKEDGKCKGEDETCAECKEQRDEFEKWVLFIRKYGERCKMLKTVYIVFCIDGRQYWTMGDPLETTWVLNRALIDEPRRVPKLEWLDK